MSTVNNIYNDTKEAIKERKRLVEVQIKTVLSLLFDLHLKSGRPVSLTPEEIHEACNVDVKGDEALFERLKKHRKLDLDGDRFSYVMFDPSQLKPEPSREIRLLGGPVGRVPHLCWGPPRSR